MNVLTLIDDLAEVVAKAKPTRLGPVRYGHHVRMNQRELKEFYLILDLMRATLPAAIGRRSPIIDDAIYERAKAAFRET